MEKWQNILSNFAYLVKVSVFKIFLYMNKILFWLEMGEKMVSQKLSMLSNTV